MAARYDFHGGCPVLVSPPLHGLVWSTALRLTFVSGARIA